jgi:recombination protein RecT
MANAADARKQEQALVVRETMRSYRGELVAALPSHLQEQGPGWLAAALAKVKANDGLLQVASQSPESLIQALQEAAALGLRPGTDEYYLTPKAGKVLGVEGYQGKVERMYRAGAVESVVVELVYANDQFVWRPGIDDKPQHTIDWWGERGEIKGAYAYAVMKGGKAISKVVIVDKARIERAQEASATAGRSHSPWTSDYGAMVLKTAAHDLEKWVPTSAEYMAAQYRAKVEGEKPAPGGAGTQAAPAPAAPAGQAEPTGQVDPEDAAAFEDLGEQAPQGERDFGGAADAEDSKPKPCSAAQQRMLGSLLQAAGYPTKETRMNAIGNQLGRQINDFGDITKDEAAGLITDLQEYTKRQQQPPVDPASAPDPNDVEPPLDEAPEQEAS